MSEFSEKQAVAVNGILDNLDLCNMARDYTKLTDTSVRMEQVFMELEAQYPGGIIQFYNEKKF